MYCSNCGKKLEVGQAYCAACGSKAGEGKKTQNIEISFGNAPSGRNVLDRLGEDKIVFFAAIFLQIVSLFLVGREMFVVSYELFNTRTLKMTIFEEKEALKYIFYAGYILAVGMMLIPLVAGKDWDKAFFIPGMCMPVVSVVWLFVILINAEKQMASSEYGYILEQINTTTKLTENAWIFLLVSAAAVLLTYKASNDVIITQENRHRNEQREQEFQERVSGDNDESVKENQIVCPKCGLVQKKGGAFCKNCFAPFFKL